MNVVKRVFQTLIILFMCALFIRGVMFLYTGKKLEAELRVPHIAVVDFVGVIIDVNEIRKTFTELEKNDFVKGYVLRVNSPGGLVTPSQELYEYFLTLQKPLYVAMSSTAASGGYMISLPAEKIYAMPSTITGSIGVIMQMSNYEGLMDKIGIKKSVIKSGKFKDTGNAYRPMTEEDKKALSDIVMDMYEQFVDAVSNSRKLSIAETKALADGRIFTGKMAKENGLIDELGSWVDAVNGLNEELDKDYPYFEVNADKNVFSKLMSFTENGADMITKPEGFYFMIEY